MTGEGLLGAAQLQKPPRHDDGRPRLRRVERHAGGRALVAIGHVLRRVVPDHRVGAQDVRRDAAGGARAEKPLALTHHRLCARHVREVDGDDLRRGKPRAQLGRAGSAPP